MKIGPVHPEIIGLQGINDSQFRRIVQKVLIYPLVNFAVTGPSPLNLTRSSGIIVGAAIIRLFF